MDPGAALVLLLLWVEPVSLQPAVKHEEFVLEALAQTPVLLPCSAPEGSDLENLALEWTRPDLEERYVFLFRDGRPFLVYQHPQFKGRVELSDPTLLSGDLSIKLSHAHQQDSGRYECHVFSQSHARKRSVYDTQPIRTIDLTVRGREPETIRVFPGGDVLLRLDKPDFSVTSLMWKREDDPEHYVFLYGMDHPHHQHPRYAGRTELTPDRTGDLTVTLHNVQPSDSGTYHGRIIQSQHRAKRELRPSEPDRVVVLEVLASGALGLEGGAAFVIAVVMAMFLQLLE